MRKEMLMKKRNMLLALLLLLLVLLVGCGQEAKEESAPDAETYAFTDSAGRTVMIPKQIDRIAPSGGLAQMALFAIAPDRLVGVSGQWKDTVLPFVGDQYRDLPVLGQFYGMKNFNVVGVKFCRGGNTTLAIILSGIIVSTLFTSLLSMIKYVADPYDKLPVIVYWLMGSLASITRDNLILPLLLMAAAFLLLYFLQWKINLLSFGDEEAKSLGIPVERLRLTVIICATLMTAAAVAISGIIGLVGLVVPHLVRFIVGPDFRFLLPGSALMGGLFLLASDNLARTLWTMEIPLGILTSLFGVPFFLYLLIKYHHS